MDEWEPKTGGPTEMATREKKSWSYQERDLTLCFYLHEEMTKEVICADHLSWREEKKMLRSHYLEKKPRERTQIMLQPLALALPLGVLWVPSGHFLSYGHSPFRTPMPSVVALRLWPWFIYIISSETRMYYNFQYKFCFLNVILKSTFFSS